jgi:hypothetical protein
MPEEKRVLPRKNMLDTIVKMRITHILQWAGLWNKRSSTEMIGCANRKNSRLLKPRPGKFKELQ